MKIEVAKVKEVVGTGYPKPYDEPCLKRSRKRLGDAAKLTQFGVNMLTLKPGVWSAQRHWHTKEDEFVFVAKGEVVLVGGRGRFEIWNLQNWKRANEEETSTYQHVANLIGL